MTFTAGSLAQALSNVYRHFLDSLTCENDARLFDRDWPSISRTLCNALHRIGGPVAWLDREPLGPADDTPYVIASIDPATGMVRFDPATEAQAWGLPSADRFAWDGAPLA